MTAGDWTILGVGFLLATGWVLRSAYKGRLRIGFALAAIGTLTALVAVEAAAELLGEPAGRGWEITPSGIRTVGFVGVGLVLAHYMLVKLTLQSNKLAALVQELAIREAALKQARDTAGESKELAPVSESTAADLVDVHFERR